MFTFYAENMISYFVDCIYVVESLYSKTFINVFLKRITFESFEKPTFSWYNLYVSFCRGMADFFLLHVWSQYPEIRYMGGNKALQDVKSAAQQRDQHAGTLCFTSIDIDSLFLQCNYLGLHSVRILASAFFQQLNALFSRVAWNNPKRK